MSERESGPPALRASDADRERVAAVLRDAGGDGRLDLEELDERLQAAYAARTHADLEPLTADLQPSPGMPVASAGSRQVGFSVKPGEGGARWLVSFMGRSPSRSTSWVARTSTSTRSSSAASGSS
jgi:hypothetical protein